MFTPERILLMVFGFTFAVGAADYFCGGKLNLGKKFTDGLQTFGPLFLTMAGFLVLSPWLARVLAPAASALFESLGADPALAAGMLLANDNGAYPLAQSLAKVPVAGGFGGMLLGSIVGANIVSMPLIFVLLDKEDHAYYFKGLMYGIIAMPLALFIGGLSARYDVMFILRQMPPLLILAFTAALLLYLVPELLTRALRIFAKAMEFISLSGITIALFMELAGKPLSGITPVGEAVKIIGFIAVMLGGVYVFTELLTRLLKKILSLGKQNKEFDETSAIGFLTTLANAIPTMAALKKMSPKGKMLNCAFLSCGAYALGDHLAYCSAEASHLIFPMLTTKLTGAVIAATLALFFWKEKCHNV